MTDYDIIFKEDDVEHIAKKQDLKLAEAVRSRVEKKRNQLRFVDSFRAAANRFWNFFGYNGMKIAELKVEHQSKHHRAFFVAVQETGDFVFFDIVEKEGDYSGSEQYQMILGMRKNVDDVMGYARDRVLQTI